MANERQLIDKNVLIHAIGDYMATNAYLNDTALDVLKLIARWVDDAPTVEVVRCKDCKHAKELGEAEKKIYLDECLICTSGDATIDGYNIVMPEHFCSYGEKREVE